MPLWTKIYIVGVVIVFLVHALVLANGLVKLRFTVNREDSDTPVTAAMAFAAISSAVGTGCVWPLSLIFWAWHIPQVVKMHRGSPEPVQLTSQPAYWPDPEESKNLSVVEALIAERADSTTAHPLVITEACMRVAWMLTKRYMVQVDQERAEAQWHFMNLAETTCYPS